ncbi:hypothetical protein J5N97_027322 [Dioscorea zingiberensis]|uniref:Endonuclease/exonuclease/phosphatase domain-containing protein n=1 Tax=Dioscorea zingiberensis TaxID=325984 RepID=A0A9D5H7I5_9LILI|nr:hypothetical protein J5N97_027322 [Dioscorea zingiberensis]
MGNAESSSETPRRKYDDDDDDDDDNIRRWLRRPTKKENDEGESSTQFSTVLKVGAAVAAGGLLTLGAYSTLSSSSPSPSAELEAHEVKRNKYNYERKIKIMSYNVWSSGMEVEKRMEAIGNLVKQYSPDIIFFQEVTPNIYKLFERSTWWQLYNTSVSSPDGRKPFCMLLSKLRVEMFKSITFSNSMEKELCLGVINVGLYKRLIVATSHLKCQTNEMTNSEERVSQAKEALRNLQQFPNVIFGGDMNWDEEEDGVFPLQGSWTDAWAELRTREPGWTFDTESNEMLKGRKPLQKRLDRFSCKLEEDFRMMNIEMIGKEAIPDLTYCNEKGMELPVLPSDHYGLIFTISSNV